MAASSGIAAPSVTDVSLTCSGSVVGYNFTPFSMSPFITASPGDTFTITNPNANGVGDATLTLPSGYLSSSLTIASGTSVTITVGPATATIVINAAASGASCSGKPAAEVEVQVTSGGGGASSSSAPASAPTVETLQVGVSGSDTTCTGGNPTGFSGSWLQLPAAGDCQQTGPKAIPNAKLLGWATDPNFPVAIAQRQVNNGWGAYETFNAEGAMTGVFIPAGGSTFISGSNTLYPIWSS